VRGFLDERFYSQSRRNQGKWTWPCSPEATSGSRKSGAGEEWRKATSGSVHVVIQGKGFVCRYEEDILPAQGRLAPLGPVLSWSRRLQSPLPAAYTAVVSNDFLQPITLRGDYVELVPLSMDHLAALVLAVEDGELWKLWYTSVPSPEGMAAEIRRRLALHEVGSMLPFTVIAADTGQIVGMTTLMHIDVANRRAEIGSTWYARRVQRTGLNTEAKLLLLADAFDRLGCIAVEFRTHFINQQSRRAIERLGAKLDGILRSHMVMPNGTLRDTCVYSVIASEWPTVRSHLRWQLGKVR
jgi:RimJ/RimL family protein N-acetyltransferase